MSLLPCLVWLCLRLAVSSVVWDPLQEEGPEVACLDHSDCTRLGHKFGCLVYRCVDHTRAAPCHAHTDCRDQRECVKTHLPGFPVGVCVPPSSLLPCSPSCSCCGGTCCPPGYQSQWRDMSCLSHHQCRSWATGQYCCQDNKCCDTSPDYHYLYEDYQDYTTETYYDYQPDINYTQYSDDIFNDTTTESIGNETYFEYESYDDNEDNIENTTVEIVTIDQIEDNDEESVKVATFYETLSRNSTDEESNHDSNVGGDYYNVVEDYRNVSEDYYNVGDDYDNDVISNVENVTENDHHYSGWGEVTEESSSELFDSDLSGDIEVQIENFSSEAEQRELSTVLSVSSVSPSETSGDSDTTTEGFVDVTLQEEGASGSGEALTDLQVESGSGDDMLIEGENYEHFDGSGILSDSTDDPDDLNDRAIIDDSQTGVENISDDNLKDVTVVDLTKHLESSTKKEVAWKSDATVKEIISFQTILLFMILPLTL